MMHYGFNHNDSIIYDQPDGQHHTQQGKYIDGKSKQRKENESTNERYRYGQQWNKSCSPVLQENEYNYDYQDYGFQQRMNNFFDTRTNGQGCIQRIIHVQVLW